MQTHKIMRKIVLPCLGSILLLSCNSEQAASENGGKTETVTVVTGKAVKQPNSLTQAAYIGNIKAITEYRCITTKNEMTEAQVKADKETSKTTTYYNISGNDSATIYQPADGRKTSVFIHDYTSPLPLTPNAKNVNFKYYKWLENNKLTTRRIEYVDAEYYTAIDTLSFDDQGRLIMQSQNLVTHARSGNDTTKGIIYETVYTDKDEMKYTIK